MNPETTIVWLRRDLRLADNPALFHACERGTAIPLYVWAPEEETPPPGAASRWWIHHALESLSSDLARKGSRLIIRRGSTVQTLREIIAETGATAVCWTRLYEPALARRDLTVDEALRAQGIAVRTFASQTLHEPELLRTTQREPYKVFTPFWNRLRAQDPPPEPLPIPRFASPVKWPQSETSLSLKLLPKVDWAAGLRDTWGVSERAALDRLKSFTAGALDPYDTARDFPALDGTSRLSPYIHHGLLSPRQVWHSARGADAFLRQLAWREFSIHILHHFPHTANHPMREEFCRFPWREDPAALAAWQRGLTGYPLVDAGMRQLWHTGWMHNRVRMVAASFLTKHLLLPWQFGAQWFWDTLVDADLANNSMGWQWVAGCGADAAPYFRVFNPAAQGEKFDAAADYVRHWVPELSRLPAKFLFAPSTAPRVVLDAAGVTLGQDYPLPIVDHTAARERALAAYHSLKHKS